MARRQGYSPLLKALEWIGKRQTRDVTTQIGGVLGIGIHQVTVVEKWDNGDSTDFILQSNDGLSHKERTWGYSRGRLKLGYKYTIELVPAEAGTHRIEASSGGYKLLAISTGMTVFSADNIKDVYGYVRGKNIRLAYLKVKWAKETC